MAKANQVIQNKTFGDKVKFLVTAEGSKGELLKVELWVKPGGVGPPVHYHPVQYETFEVVKGELSLAYKGQRKVLKQGEKFTVGPNVAHTFSNNGSEELIAIVSLRPAMKTEFFIETMYALDVEGKTNKKGLPNTLQFAAILNECYGEFFIAGLPVPLQKFMAKIIGGLAKRIGYRGYIPYPEN